MKKLNPSKVYHLPKNPNNKYTNSVTFFYNPNKIECYGSSRYGDSDWTYVTEGDCCEVEPLALSVIDMDNNYLYERPESLEVLDISGEDFIKKLMLTRKLKQ